MMPLCRTTLAAWLFWFATMGLLWGQILSNTLHFRPLPLIILLLGLLLSTLLAVGFSFRPFLSGNQVRVSAWLFVALMPLMLLIAPCLYARQRQTERQFTTSWAMHLARAVGASLMEVDIAFRYPHRLETSRLVMFYDRLSAPRQDAEAMERHIAQLEARIGHPLRSKIHWVRGSALGQTGLSFYGLALGSDRSYNEKSPPEKERAVDLDRHELAHAVLTQQEPWNVSPPAFLSEGWAEWQGVGSQEIQRRAQERRKRGDTTSFATLLQPTWYYKHDGPAYTQGGAFVEFLTRRYGMEKFLRLYNTTTQRTFRADCRRIFGEDIEALERRFWQEPGIS